MNFPKPSVGMLPNDRLTYSPIATRRPLKLPGNARMVVWTIVNVEEWSIERNMPRTVLPPPYGQPLPMVKSMRSPRSWAVRDANPTISRNSGDKYR